MPYKALKMFGNEIILLYIFRRVTDKKSGQNRPGF